MKSVFAILIGVLALTFSLKAEAQLPPGAVVCSRSGNNIKYCQAGKTCCNAAGKCSIRHTCTPKGCVAPMSCSVCASNQKRDSDACMTSGDLLQTAIASIASMASSSSVRVPVVPERFAPRSRMKKDGRLAASEARATRRGHGEALDGAAL